MTGGNRTTARPGRQRDILVTFTEKVALRGYDATSLSEVAQELGLSKGTIIHHYGSKDRLLRQMSMDYMERRIAELRLIEDEHESPAQRLACIITAIITAFRDDGPATRAFSREFMRFVEDPVMEDVRAAREQYTAIVRETVEAGMAAGQLRAADPAIVTLQLIGMCNWAWTWLRPGGQLSVDEIAASYTDTFLGGLLARRGTKAAAQLPASVVALRRAA